MEPEKRARSRVLSESGTRDGLVNHRFGADGKGGTKAGVGSSRSARSETNSESGYESSLAEAEQKRIIRKMGLKVTQQRLAILGTLQNGHVHITAQEVFEQVNATHPEIGFATVYRFLRKMAEQKLVTEVRMGGLPARYELTPRHHHDHLTCTQCGRIVEFENDLIESLQEKVAEAHRFRLTHHVLELYGVCPNCQSVDEGV